MSNRRRRAAPVGLPRMVPEFPDRPEVKTYWNGEEADAEHGTAVVADSPDVPNYWARDRIGCRVPVVRVVYGDEEHWLYNLNGSAWRKVTLGKGTPHWPHYNLSIEEGSFRAER